MPIYTYRCRDCGHEFDKTQKMSDAAVDACEKCGKPVSRVFHPVGIIFKGSGFYKTDNAKKDAARESTAKPEEAKKDETPKKSEASKDEGTKSESKPESKPDAKKEPVKK